MSLNYSFHTLEQFIGKELGVSEWIVITQDMVNQFAETTGDKQWIHVDVERSRRESPYGGPIAHAFMSLSMVAGMMMQIGAIPSDVAAALNYGIDRARFPAPVPVGARIRNRAVLTDVTDQGGGRKIVKITNTVEVEGQAKPAIVAETLAMLIGRP